MLLLLLRSGGGRCGSRDRGRDRGRDHGGGHRRSLLPRASGPRRVRLRSHLGFEPERLQARGDAGHRQEYFVDDDHRVAHEEIDAEVKDMLMAMPDTLPTLTDHDFDRFVKMNGL